MKAIKLIKKLAIGICILTLTVMMFMGAILQTSYRYYAPTEDEIAQMGWFERWVYEPFRG